MAERHVNTIREVISKVAQSAWSYLSAPAEASRNEQRLDAHIRISNGLPVSRLLIDELASDIRLLVAARDRFPSLSFRNPPNMQELRLDNRYACRALLKDAIEPGENSPKHARAEYERRRFLQLDFMPEYVRAMCSQECKENFRKVKVTIDPEISKESDLLHYARRFNKEHIREDKLLDNSHFSACMTFEAGARLLEALKPTEFKKHYSVTDLGSEILIHDRFSPGSDGPLGKAATDAWIKMSHISLSAVLLEDLLPQLPFPLSEDGKRSAIERALAPGGASAWDIANSPLLKNARDLHDLYEAGAVSAEVVKVLVGKSAALLRNDLNDQIADIQHALARKASKQTSLSSKQRATVEPPAPPREIEDASRGAEGNPKWEFYRAIHSACPDETFDKRFRERYAPLYRLYRSSDMPLHECIDIARADAAIPTTYIGSHARAEGTLPKRSPIWRRRTSHDSDSPPASEHNNDGDLAVRYTVMGTEQAWFHEWRAALDPISRQIVDKRLERVAEGNFGDWRKLTTGGAFHELRVHYGAGQRLYYRFTSATSIELVAAGSKAEQPRTLRRLSEIGKE